MLSVSAKKRRGAFLLDAQFELPTPGVVALFGRSGCGKTTLVNVIAGLLPADSGRVALDDSVLLDTAVRLNVPPEERRIGYVFQDARLFPHLRVEANLRYALKRAAVAPFVGMDRVVELLDLKAAAGASHPSAFGRRASTRRHRSGLVVSAELVIAGRAVGLARRIAPRRGAALPGKFARPIGHPDGVCQP